MLNTLRKKSKQEIQHILASITSSLLPNPDADQHDSSVTSKLEFEDVIDEIKSTLKINPDDFSDLAKSKIYKFLANEMYQTVLSSSKVKDVRNRVGQKGALKPDLYDIVYLETFNKHAQSLPLDKKEIEKTVRYPNFYNHLFNEDVGAAPVSLFSKVLASKVQGNTCSMLVMAERMGSIQNIYNAWPIYHSDVDVSKAEDSLDILKAFLEVYGIEIRSKADGNVSKFFSNLIFRNYSNQEPANFLELELGSKRAYELSILANNNPIKQETVIGLTFAIDIDKYYSDLQTHGVKAVLG
jgi:hypothetical protein